MTSIGRDLGPRQAQGPTDEHAVEAPGEPAQAAAVHAPAARDPALDRAREQAIAAVTQDAEFMRRADSRTLATLLPDGLGLTTRGR